MLTLHRLQINEPTEDGKPKEPENPPNPQTEEVGRVGTVEGSCTGRWVGWEAVQAHLFCCCKGVNCRNTILVVQIHFNVWKKSIYHWHPLTIDCESTMEASRVDMGMFGGTVLFLSDITCWNTKFGLIDWRGIQNMTSGIFYRKTTWIYIPRTAIAKRFLQKRIE